MPTTLTPDIEATLAETVKRGWSLSERRTPPCPLRSQGGACIMHAVAAATSRGTGGDGKEKNAAMRTLLNLLCALLALTIPAGAQSLVRPTGQPDIVCLVFAGANGQDQIGFTYPGIVPRSRALRDLRALQEATGLKLRAVKITEDVAPVKSAKVKMTGVEALVSHAITPASHHFNVEQIVSAFRRYPRLALTYFVGDGFQFQGLRAWSDDHVQITLDQHGAAYTYQVLIRDPSFRRLNLPTTQPPLLDLRTARGGDPNGGADLRRSVLLGLAALAVGAGVYALAARRAR